LYLKRPAPHVNDALVLFWAACRAGEAVRDGLATDDFCTRVLLAAALHPDWISAAPETLLQVG